MNLPSTRPCWYGVSEEQKEAGWIPKTEDIAIKENSHLKNSKINDAWKNHIHYENPNATVKIEGLKPISPIQVGGGSLPEDHILPANIAGVPVIPGSSLRGAFLNWMRKIWDSIKGEEKLFWEELIDTENWRWKPKKIRFENINIDDLLKPFPLNPQQEWQIFYDQSSRNKLGVQWQIPAVEPSKNITSQIIKKKNVTPPLKAKGSLPPICIQINNSYNVSEIQKEWLANRFQAMLKEQGVGRGTASGFGRIAKEIPNQGIWEIKLTGMKPCIQANIKKQNQQGSYRWNPQVLRACLRGYFNRLALLLFSKNDATNLTNKLFGNTNLHSKISLTSYLSYIEKPQKLDKDFYNIPVDKAYETWVIQVNCNTEFENLVDQLLKLASFLGGLGPGWKRPPHDFRGEKLFRGSQFSVKYIKQKEDYSLTCQNVEQEINNLLTTLLKIIRNLPEAKNLVQRQGNHELGSIIGIWKGASKEIWKKIVHEVCSSSEPDKPDWCGISAEDIKNKKALKNNQQSSKTIIKKSKKEERPSGYAVREYKQENFCLITVFEPEMTCLFDPNSQTQLAQDDKRMFIQIWKSGG
ncbi:RAMP superfamily CRISPR-associated protein [Planktothrix agardhii]|jgi:CRISPR-associated protein Cmr6|uniref:RAMP superfamily CRISPR-associated protein n=1 Tax=Planktothrix agardhii TaxID=1160 RepID=UPI001F3E4A77|nr:RAMP superfamily CRISPR-associated protein [Planktothrix agardhii]MCF3574659.1 RAMP superfamily CRISPR-associated protein [Planktothrix agardhii 1812]MCF3648062.1 RAMP superfamily CRISPR-associated protein [Planktothrix agardhii 1026]